MKEKTYIKIIEWIAMTLILATIIAAISNGIKKIEMDECQKWQEWEELYPHFSSNNSMREQCGNYNIKLERRWEE